MTPSLQVRKETPRGSGALLLGQLRRRHGRLATLGLAILVAASFTVLTASAATTSVHAGQTLKHRVLCVSNFKERACKTPMRLVCHKSLGRTVLRRIPQGAYWAQSWHIDFVPYHHWGADGPPVTGGRLSIRTPHGVRREEAVVSLAPTAPPGQQVLIWARCS